MHAPKQTNANDSQPTRTPTRRGGAFAKLLVGLVLVGGVGGAGWYFTTRDADNGDDSQVQTSDLVPASVMTFEIATTASGELQAMDQIEIRSQLEQQTTIIELVPEGTRVKTGDVLAVLNADALQTELEDDEIGLESERAELIAAENSLEIQKSDNASAIRDAELKLRLSKLALEQWESGDNALKLQELDLNIEEANRELERLQEKHDRNIGLLEEGFISEDQYKQDQLSLIRARARVQTVQLQKLSYVEYQQKRDREQKESDVTQATAELERVERENIIRLADKQATLTSRQRRVSRRETQIAEMKSQIIASTIHAPSDGLVVYGSTVEQSRNRWGGDGPMQIGQAVYPNRLMFALPDTSKLVAEVRVHESLAGRIKPGQKASIRVDAASERVFNGTVTEIGVLAEGGGWRDPNLREYTVTIAVEYGNDTGLLKPSMRCEANLILGTVEDSLAVPVPAVFNDGPVRYVYLSEGGNFVRRPVQTGRTSDTFVEIVAGIEPGTRVLIREPTAGEIIQQSWDEGELQLVGLALDDDGKPVRAEVRPGSPSGQSSPASFTPGG